MWINKAVVENILKAVKTCVEIPSSGWVADYDSEADVLYITFGVKDKATDSQVIDDNIILRYKNKKLIGVTVLNYSSLYGENIEEANHDPLI